MIIPVRCFTCGKVIADKWRHFSRRREEIELERERESGAANNTTDTDGFYDQRLGALLDELHLTRICCRRHLLCHVDLIDDI